MGIIDDLDLFRESESLSKFKPLIAVMYGPDRLLCPVKIKYRRGPNIIKPYTIHTYCQMVYETLFPK